MRCWSRRATGGLDGWSPSTESGLQACYGKPCKCRAFYFASITGASRLRLEDAIELVNWARRTCQCAVTAPTPVTSVGPFITEQGAP